MDNLFKHIAKFFRTVVIWTLLVLFLGSMLNIEFEEWVKISIPKPSVKIEKHDDVSRETPVNTVKTKRDTIIVYKEKSKPKQVKGRAFKLDDSKVTSRSTSKGENYYSTKGR